MKVHVIEQQYDLIKLSTLTFLIKLNIYCM